MELQTSGSLAFGLVVGWVTYRTIRRTQTNGLSDISAVIGAVGGGTVTALFPSGSNAFGAYGIGLAIGFVLYLIISLVVAAKTEGLSKANEWLGEAPGTASSRPPAVQSGGGFRPQPRPPGS